MKNKEEDIEELIPHVIDGCVAKINDEEDAMGKIMVLQNLLINISFLPDKCF